MSWWRKRIPEVTVGTNYKRFDEHSGNRQFVAKLGAHHG